LIALLLRRPAGKFSSPSTWRTASRLDADPIELPQTEARLRALGFGPDTFTRTAAIRRPVKNTLPQGLSGVDLILADLAFLRFNSTIRRAAFR